MRLGRRGAAALLVAAGIIGGTRALAGAGEPGPPAGLRACWVFLETAGSIEPIRERGLSPRIRHLSRWLRAASIFLTPEEARDLASDPRVRGIRPVARFGAEVPPQIRWDGVEEDAIPVHAKAAAMADQDPRTLGPADYGSTWNQLEMLGVPELHRRGYSGDGVKVALFDTGFFKEHVSLSQRIRVAERDFVGGDGDTGYDPNDPGDAPQSSSHGTYTWSTLGGFDPGRQVGAAYRASFVLARTEDVLREVHAEEDNYVAALEWADSLGVDIVSTSLGYRYFDDGSAYSFGELDGETLPITIATERAAERGILVITAMGNEGPEGGSLGAPADGKRVASVGAVDSRGLLADFSSRGPTADGRIKPDVVAQGIGVACASASTPASYTYASGTSLSTPLIAGLAALLREARPDWGPDSLIAALRRSGDRSGSPGNEAGWGIPDGLRALRSTDPRLAIEGSSWRDEDGRVDGIAGFGETGALRLWIRNVGRRASGPGTAHVSLHSPLFSLIDSTAAVVPAIAPADSALVTVARMSIGGGEDIGYYSLFVRIAAAGDTVDRKVVIPVIPGYSISGLQASADEFGAVHLLWSANGSAILRARVYRAAPPETSQVLLFEETLHHPRGEWVDRVSMPGTYRYWVSAVLVGGSESPMQGPVEATTSAPSTRRLGMPFPNPVSRGIVSIPLAWPAGRGPRVEIYDVTGRRIRTLTGRDAGPGFPLVPWDLASEDGRGVATGWYVVRVPGAGSARVLVVR